MAIGLMLAVSRRIVANDGFVRAGSWHNGAPPISRRVSGRAVGIVGLGRIGRAVARRVAAFDMTVRYTDLQDQKAEFEFEPSLRQLAVRSDVLIVAASSAPGAGRLIDRAVLDALGPEGIVVNVARGNLVDEDALVQALADGRLGGAGLDVFVAEPNVPEGLLAHPNVVLQPHQASATEEARRAMGQLVLDNVRAYFAGVPLLSPVVPE